MKNRKIGVGSLGEIYYGIENVNGEEFACKMISKKNFFERINFRKGKSSTGKNFMNIVKKEAEIWKKIKHCNIVKFKDFLESQNNIYFFNEFCSKG